MSYQPRTDHPAIERVVYYGLIALLVAVAIVWAVSAAVSWGDAEPDPRGGPCYDGPGGSADAC